ncbi:hypothetical protein FACS189442_5400 [Spirochaetia bacterium]|nr:hypothetical protein FACS189442_5400 [Spirochaetia bacterium]
MSLEKRQMIACEVKRLHTLTGIAILTLVFFAGVSKRTWREWQERSDQETRHNGQIPRDHWLTPEETQAILEFCSERINIGYRPLCYEMLDFGVTAVSPASVYNVLKRHNMTKQWAELTEDAQKGFTQPCRVHEQWHIDFSYIKTGGAFYYFISILDGYSRKILVWELCETMDGINAEVLVTRAKELYPHAKQRIINDNGSQFCSKDFRELIVLLELEQTAETSFPNTSPAHPQSNGKLERFHRTFKTEHVRQTAYLGYTDAKARMSRWIAYYNTVRLHSAIWYLPPEDVFQGRVERRLAERREKLHTACINRRSYWQNQTAALRTT